jgi:hypothetical protein
MDASCPMSGEHDRISKQRFPSFDVSIYSSDLQLSVLET